MRSFFIFILLAGPILCNPIDLKNYPFCSVCELLVDVFVASLPNQNFDNSFYELVEFVCVSLQIENGFVCHGMISEFRNESIYIFETILSENPNDLCGILQLCDSKWNPMVANWFLTMPGLKPEHKDPPAPPQNKTMKVLQLSDIHIDTQYQPGSEANCSDVNSTFATFIGVQCCRPTNDTIELAREVKVAAQYWGTVGNCDLPYWTAESMLQHINMTHRDIDYVVISGDLESHAVNVYTRETHEARIKNVSDLIRAYFSDIPVYFALGNHEGVPIDNIPPHFVPDEFKPDWLYETLADAWHDWVPEDQIPILKYRGSYMVKIAPGLRLISLNNVLGDPINFFLLINQTDPDGTMSWLIDQLIEAEYAGDKVQIVAHIPGADTEAYEGWAINYYNTVNRFEDTIVAQFFGHEHSEQYYMTYLDPEDATSRPTSVIFSAPSATTQDSYNPTYRIYTIDGPYEGATYQILDFEEWFLNLTKYGNADKVVWKQLYRSAKTVYGLNSMAPSEWNDLIGRMQVNDTLFQMYIRNYYRRDGVTCDADCKKSQLCSIRMAHHTENLCKDLIPEGGIMKKRNDRLFSKPKRLVQTRKEALKLLEAYKKNHF